MSENNQYPSVFCPGVDLIDTPGQHIVFRTVDGVAQVCKQLHKRIIGQLSVEHEHDDAIARGGIQVMMCAFPEGDFYVWFVEVNHFILFAQVGGKAKTLCLMPTGDPATFLKQVNHVANQLNLKHGYPIEEPEDFVPAGDENEPDQQS